MQNLSHQSCLEKQEKIKNLFASRPHAEAKYALLIELGKGLEPLDPCEKNSTHIVEGCQSTLYLVTFIQEGKIFFKASSEAFISAGLASLLLSVYNGESPETVVQCPPAFIKDMGLHLTLSPGRSNGLASMYTRMQKESLKIILNKEKTKI